MGTTVRPLRLGPRLALIPGLALVTAVAAAQAQPAERADVPIGILPTRGQLASAVAPPPAVGTGIAAAPTGSPVFPPANTPPTGPMFERDEDAPLAGYTNGAAFIRSRDSNFVLFPNGRLNIDGFLFPNTGEPPSGVTRDGLSDQRPRDTIFVRRARAELNGTFLKKFDFMIAGEFATIPLQAQSAAISDAFINANFTTWANIMVGQFDAPFTLENRTVDKYIDFMERSITVRAFGVPNNKEIGLMVHGFAPTGAFHYELGLFNGDGPNVKNPDSHFDVMGRAYFAPLALLSRARSTRWLSEIWIGGSFWWGNRVDVPYDTTPINTQGGVTILPFQFGGAPTTNLCNVGCRFVPNGELLKWALELNVPVGPLGFRFELVNNDHEGMGVYRATDSTPAERLLPLNRVLAGNMKRSGTSFYLQAWYWILGGPGILPTPGQEIPLRWQGYRKDKERFPLGLYISARYERMVLHQDESDPTPSLQDVQRAGLGTVTMDSFGVAANLWWSRHFRFSMNYLVNFLDGDMPLIQGGVRIPAPPAANLPQPTIPYYRTAEHELLFRVAVAL